MEENSDNSEKHHAGHEHTHENKHEHGPEQTVRHEMKEEKKMENKDEKTHRYLLYAAVAQIILLLFIAWQVQGLANGTTGGVVANNVPANTGPSDTGTAVDMTGFIDDDEVWGKDNAPVTIIEWSDYECPYCEAFYTQTEGQIMKNYVETGKVKFVYRDFPLSFHPQAQKAAEAAECAGEQGKYKEMHDLLFEKGVASGVTGFKQYAKDLSLDTTKFNTCLDTGAMAAEVAKDMADGQAAGIQGTPGFLINGKLVSGAQPYQVFQQAIEAALKA